MRTKKYPVKLTDSERKELKHLLKCGKHASSPGCPYDNAAMENFFDMLKTECLYRMKFSCRAEVQQAIGA